MSDISTASLKSPSTVRKGFSMVTLAMVTAIAAAPMSAAAADLWCSDWHIVLERDIQNGLYLNKLQAPFVAKTVTGNVRKLCVAGCDSPKFDGTKRLITPTAFPLTIDITWTDKRDKRWRQEFKINADKTYYAEWRNIDSLGGSKSETGSCSGTL